MTGTNTLDAPPYARIPFDEILDPLNALSDDAGILAGRVYVDLNANCAFDAAADHPLNAQVVAFSPGGLVTATAADGRYGRALPPGTYQVQTPILPYHDVFCNPPASAAVQTGVQTQRDVVIRPTQAVQDLRLFLTGGRLRPGQPCSFTLTVQNRGTSTSPAGVAVRFTFGNNALTFVGATPAPAATAPGEVEFSLPAIAAYQSVKLRVVLQLPPDPALTGQLFAFTGAGIDNFADAAPADNVATLLLTVTNSFDPNDKTAFYK